MLVMKAMIGVATNKPLNHWKKKDLCKRCAWVEGV